MKILHTADWHIGKVLHKHSLLGEMNFFFDWLYEYIKDESIDVLLVSGDIFDLANPGAKDRESYYRFLSRLIPLQLQIVITGGNHDGIGVINAPKELLGALNIAVIGGAKENLEDELIEIKNKEGKLELVVAAVPFLRDRDLRSLNTDKQFDSRAAAIKAGIAKHYLELAQLCEEKYKGLPAIAMGHLYAKGVTSSESERDIHIGNAAAVEASIFPEQFGYVALGHIHRPQIINKNEYIRYSGSPISLSFSEKKDSKGVLVLELENGKFSSPEFVDIPKQRELRKIKGSFEQVSLALKTYKNDFQLAAFFELEFIEETFSDVILGKVSEIESSYEGDDRFVILKSKTIFSTGAKDTSDLFTAGDNIEDLTPLEVFATRIESEEIAPEKRKQLLDTFKELLEIVETEEL